jgi:hypothetical protein
MVMRQAVIATRGCTGSSELLREPNLDRLLSVGEESMFDEGSQPRPAVAWVAQ